MSTEEHEPETVTISMDEYQRLIRQVQANNSIRIEVLPGIVGWTRIGPEGLCRGVQHPYRQTISPEHLLRLVEGAAREALLAVAAGEKLVPQADAQPVV